METQRGGPAASVSGGPARVTRSLCCCCRCRPPRPSLHSRPRQQMLRWFLCLSGRTPGPWLHAEAAGQSSDDIKGRNSQVTRPAGPWETWRVCLLLSALHLASDSVSSGKAPLYLSFPWDWHSEFQNLKSESRVPGITALAGLATRPL